MDEPRDCKHGQLARACDRCADAAEIAELREALAEAKARALHEADCAAAYKAEAGALRAAPWIGRCQACGHEHEAVRAKANADARQLQHCAIAVSDWLAGGCDVQDIPRPHIAALVAWTKETTAEAAAIVA